MAPLLSRLWLGLRNRIDACMLPQGRVRGYDVFSEPGEVSVVGGAVVPGRWVPYCDFKPNLFMYEGAEACAQLLRGEATYKAAGMYIEFQNVADPDDLVTVPTYGRGDGVQYYNDLVSSPDTDYLRVPLIAANLSSSDTSKYSLGNVINFVASTTGTLGVHGKTFSDSVNSKVFGGAIIAIPDENDSTKDLVISRFYFSPSRQRVKLPNSQLGVEWPLSMQ